MQLWASHFKGGLLTLLYPPQCTHCGVAVDGASAPYLCGSCCKLLEPIDPSERCPSCFSEHYCRLSRYCGECKGERGSLRSLAAAFDYMGPATSLVRALKSGSEPSIAEGLAGYMVLQFLALKWEVPDFIVPVPMAPVRRFFRGYNQSLLLASAVGKLLGVPVLEALKRKSGDYSQAGLNRSQRLKLGEENITLSKSARVRGAKLLLIDDVVTTGATLRACGHVLACGEPACVDALTLCKAVAL